jgi:hypothetical protein
MCDTVNTEEMILYEPTSIVHYVQAFGTLGKDWNVYDDHVLINENVRLCTTQPYQECFRLIATPVGKVWILSKK